MGVRWYFPVNLICLSLILARLNIFLIVYWPFVCLLWRNVHSSPLSVLWSAYLFFCSWIVGVLHIFWVYILQIYFPICRLPFHCLDCTLLMHRSFKFCHSPDVSVFSFIAHDTSKKSCTVLWNFSYIYFLIKSFIVLALMLRSLIHF